MWMHIDNATSKCKSHSQQITMSIINIQIIIKIDSFRMKSLELSFLCLYKNSKNSHIKL